MGANGLVNYIYHNIAEGINCLKSCQWTEEAMVLHKICENTGFHGLVFSHILFSVKLIQILYKTRGFFCLTGREGEKTRPMKANVSNTLFYFLFSTKIFYNVLDNFNYIDKIYIPRVQKRIMMKSIYGIY